MITPRQFLDLNEQIGGFDEDGHHTPSRSAGDPGAIRRAYQSGLSLGANGGLRSIPIVDNATSNADVLKRHLKDVDARDYERHSVEKRSSG